MQGYNVITTRIGEDSPIPAKGCAYIEFINQGDTNVMVDDVTILPLGSWAPAPAVPGEQDWTQYRCKFTTPSTNRALIVVRKFYNE